MISREMKEYNYFTLGDHDGYGQAKLPAKDAEPVGTIKMAIYLTSQGTQDNINYKDCNYIALTRAKVDDTYIIENGSERLKVLYVQHAGRYTQVYLKKI